MLLAFIITLAVLLLAPIVAMIVGVAIQDANQLKHRKTNTWKSLSK